MKHIMKTVYPGKFAKTGNRYYISVPATVIERMGLEDGDYLDVTLEWPRMEEYDLDSLRSAKSEKKEETRNCTEN